MALRCSGPLLAILVLTAALLAPGAASAQSPVDLERARRTFAEGEEAEAAGDCETAIERYEAVAAVKETAAVRLRIGRCQERLGRLLAALAAYRRARELAQDDPRALEVATRVEEALAARVPRIEVVLDGDAPGATITLDGAAIEPRRPIEVEPGRHVLVAEAPGMVRDQVEVDVGEGEAKTVEVALLPVESGAPRAPATPPAVPREAPGPPWLPIGLAVGGGVAVGIALPLLITSVSDDADLDARCFDAEGRPSDDRDPCFRADGGAFSPAERAAFEDDRSSVNVRQGIGWALAGVGLAAAGVATVLLLTRDDDGETRTGLRIDAVEPVAGPGDAGLRLGGSF